MHRISFELASDPVDRLTDYQQISLGQLQKVASEAANEAADTYEARNATEGLQDRLEGTSIQSFTDFLEPSEASQEALDSPVLVGLSVRRDGTVCDKDGNAVGSFARTD